MILFFYLVIFVLSYQLFCVLINLVTPQLPFKNKILKSFPKISILIPARNEEHNIVQLLSDILQLSYPNYEVIVCDDSSSDSTLANVKNFSVKDTRIQYFSSLPLPEGWLGKNYACFQLSQQAKGDYFLFIDADVRIKKDILENCIFQMQNNKLKLLSIFPKQEMKTWGEKLTVPLMNQILLSLLPLIFVRISPFKSHAAANGQFMLFETNTYKYIMPHMRFKHCAVEDISIVRYYKKFKYKIACLIGDERISCRMYTSFKEAVNGFAKNTHYFFGNSILLTVLYWLITTLGFIPTLIYGKTYFLYFITVTLSVPIISSYLSKQNIIDNVYLLVLQKFVLLIIIFKLIKNKIIKKQLWKGRNIYT